MDSFHPAKREHAYHGPIGTSLVLIFGRILWMGNCSESRSWSQQFCVLQGGIFWSTQRLVSSSFESQNVRVKTRILWKTLFNEVSCRSFQSILKDGAPLIWNGITHVIIKKKMGNITLSLSPKTTAEWKVGSILRESNKTFLDLTLTNAFRNTIHITFFAVRMGF